MGCSTSTSPIPPTLSARPQRDSACPHKVQMKILPSTNSLAFPTSLSSLEKRLISCGNIVDGSLEITATITFDSSQAVTRALQLNGTRLDDDQNSAVFVKRVRGDEIRVSETICSQEVKTSDDQIESILQPLQQNLPGLIGAILFGSTAVSISSQPRLRIGVCGSRQIQDKRNKIEVTDLWHLGSCTKAMTATLAGILIERGVLDWETTVWDVFTREELKKQRLYSQHLELAGQSVHEGWRNVTMEHLLAHCGGGRGRGELPQFPAWREAKQCSTNPKKSRRALVVAMLQEGPIHPVGVHRYSNGGFILAGAMLEHLTGIMWEEMMRNEIFRPLGMTSVGFGPPISMDRTRDLRSQPWGHKWDEGEESWIQMRPELTPENPCDNPAGLGPAGTVHASFESWSKFIELHLEGSRGKDLLLQQGTFERLQTPRLDDTYMGGWRRVHRRWGGSKRVLSHSGCNGLWFCVVWIAPERDFAVLVGSNAKKGASEVCDKAARDLIRVANQDLDFV